MPFSLLKECSIIWTVQRDFYRQFFFIYQVQMDYRFKYIRVVRALSAKNLKDSIILNILNICRIINVLWVLFDVSCMTRRCFLPREFDSPENCTLGKLTPCGYDTPRRDLWKNWSFYSLGCMYYHREIDSPEENNWVKS